MSDDVALFIACQFALESDFGGSRLAQKNNNISGMRSPTLRLTLNEDCSSSFAVFASWFDCVTDYFLWLVWNHFTFDDLHDLSKFKTKLVSSNYCPDDGYIARITDIYSQFV